MKLKISKILPLLGSLLLIFVSCSKDFLEPSVVADKELETSVNTIDDLRGLLLGAYDRMNESNYYGRDFVIFGDVRSDNAYSTGNSGRFVEPSSFTVTPTHFYATSVWQQAYRVIANANIVINNTTVENTPEVLYVKGQAHAIRGLAYMDLLRLYGEQHVLSGDSLGVPIITQFKDPNIYPERATVNQVWAQVENDLLEAERLMSPQFDQGSPTHMNSWAVLGLQSRYYLYVEKWDKAAAAAKKVIDAQVGGNSRFSIGTANPGKLSPGSLFELAYTAADQEGIDGLYNILQNTTYGDVVVTSDLYNIYEASDQRRSLFSLGANGRYRVTGKYNLSNFTDHVYVIRYAEVLLNYAEALTNLSDPGALAALNVVPVARGASPYLVATIDNVLLERRKELAMEGHRFFDLVRNRKHIPAVAGGGFSSPIPYGSYLLAFPIPQAELDANPNLVQNSEY